MNSGKMEFSFLWLIENYSYCLLNWDEDLVSPEFTPEGLSGTSWTLSLHPRSLKEDYNNSVILKRSAHDAGSESFSLKFKISVNNAKGSIDYWEECEETFRKGVGFVYQPLIVAKEFYVPNNAKYLQKDTLGVLCRMWQGEGSVRKMGQCTARTRIEIEKISFVHRVENFRSLKLNKEMIHQIPSHLTIGCDVTSVLYIADTCFSKDSMIHLLKPSDSMYTLCKIKLSLLDVSGNALEICDVDYRCFDAVDQIQKLRTSFTKQSVLSKGEEYLPNDELSLLCECTFATGGKFRIEENLHAIPLASSKNSFFSAHSKVQKTLLASLSAHSNDEETLPAPHSAQSEVQEPLPAPLSAKKNTKVNQNIQHPEIDEFNAKSFSASCNQTSSVTFNQLENNGQKKNSNNSTGDLSTLVPSALDDFKALYNDQLLTDIVLKTATKSFPAHKNVLCARSSVFRAMLTNDMKEKNSDCVKVEDLEDETVQRLLLFLYSDSLEELQWETAVQLYYSADKYAIEKLKFLCSSFLVDNLSTSTASEFLLLADTHNDTERRKIVEDFILQHDEEIFGSEEWEKFIETNPQLAMKTMQLKYKRKKRR